MTAPRRGPSRRHLSAVEDRVSVAPITGCDMAVQFIIGRAGTGKTRHCFQRIVELIRGEPLGKTIHWIVPRQMTFQCERMLACESGLSGTCRVRVVSFDRLVEDVLAEVGGVAVPKVSPVGRQMIIGHLLRERIEDLRFFRSTARQVGLATELSRTFDEIERSGVVLPATRDLNAPDHHPTVAGSLRDKLHDLSLLYSAYRDFLGSERLDPHLRRQRVLGVMRDCPSLRGTTCFIDGFHDLTAFERQAIGVLGHVAAAVHVTVLLDPGLADPLHPADAHTDDGEIALLFRRTLRAYSLLVKQLREDGVEIASETLVLRENLRHAESRPLQHLEKSWERRRPGRFNHDASDISLHESEDRRSEVDAAARTIRRLVRDGLRYRQVAVLVRSMDSYGGLIEAGFRQHGIPFFIDRRRTAEHHPLVQLVRGALRCATMRMQIDDVMTVARSGLAGIERTDADLLENYYLEHRLKPPCWRQEAPWSFKVRRVSSSRDDAGEPVLEERQVDAGELDRLRRRLAANLAPLLDAMSRPDATVRHRVTGLLQMFEAAGVRKTLSEWINEADREGCFERRDEHVQAWTELVDLLDQLVELLGDKKLSGEEFLEVVDFGLEQFDLAITPPTVDQVLVGDVDRTRTHDVAAVLLLGMNDGEFPAPPSENTILSDADRQSLQDSLELDLEPETTTRLRDEAFLAYSAMTRPSRRLLLFRPRNDEAGRPTNLSLFWRKLAAMFPGLDVHPDEDTPATASQLASRLLRWVRSPDAATQRRADTLSAALYEQARLLRENRPADATHVLRILELAWSSLGYSVGARLSGNVARRLFASPLETSVSSLETFAACPFKHFARHALRLEPPAEIDPTWLDIGSVCHATLERIVKGFLDRPEALLAEQATNEQAIAEAAEASAKLVREEVLLGDARSRFLLDRVKNAVLETLRTQQRVLGAGSMRPVAVEAEFGRGKPLPPLELTVPGGTILLRGKIDRIDLSNDRVAFAVIDYKLTGRSLSLRDVYHGLTLQLLIYLAVVQNCRKVGQVEVESLVPAAALYVPLTRGQSQLKERKSLETEPLKLLLDTKPRGVINGDPAVVTMLDRALAQPGKSEVLSARITSGHKLNYDLLAGEQLKCLIDWAVKQVREIGSRILRGDIEVRPWIDPHGNTPCAHCDYLSVCRFEHSVGPYRHIKSMKPADVLAAITSNGGN